MAITTWIDTKGTRKEKKTMEKLTDGLKKILLAGIGTVAVTAEKSKDVLDDLVKKGELTVEQGKALNQELKHNAEEKKKQVEAQKKEKNISDLVAGLSAEDLEKLKAQIAKAEEEMAEKPEETAE